MMNTAEYDREAIKRYPWIEWRKPIRISTPQYTGLGCRLCIAREGFSANDAPQKLFASPAEFEQHLKEIHNAQQHGD